MKMICKRQLKSQRLALHSSETPGQQGCAWVLWAAVHKIEKEPTYSSSISQKNHFDDFVLQENIPPPLFWKSPDRALSIFELIQNLGFGRSSSAHGSLAPSCPLLSFWMFQHDPEFISCSCSAQRQFSNTFPGIQSHHSFSRHVGGRFPEDCICGSLEISFTCSYFCVAAPACKHLHENIFHAQTEPSENPNNTKISTCNLCSLKGGEWIIRLESRFWQSEYTFFSWEALSSGKQN